MWVMDFFYPPPGLILMKNRSTVAPCCRESDGPSAISQVTKTFVFPNPPPDIAIRSQRSLIWEGAEFVAGGLKEPDFTRVECFKC